MTSLKVLKTRYKEESPSKRSSEQTREALKSMVLRNFSANPKS